jgi:hypothetical protein
MLAKSASGRLHQQKNYVNGAIKLGDTASACDSSHKGVLKFVPNATASDDDKLYICMQNSTAAFNWVLVARGG